MSTISDVEKQKFTYKFPISSLQRHDLNTDTENQSGELLQKHLTGRASGHSSRPALNFGCHTASCGNQAIKRCAGK